MEKDTSTYDPKCCAREDNPESFPNINLSSQSSKLSPINSARSNPTSDVTEDAFTVQHEKVESGLFGRAGLTTPPNVNSIILKISFILLGYSFAMFANGASSRLIPPRFLILPESGATSSLSLVNRMIDKGFLMCTFRFFSIFFCLIPLLIFTKNTPPGGILKDLPIDSNKVLIPILIGLTNAGGYLPYMLLCSSTGVALWSSLTALYVLGPVTYGIIVKNESRGKMKLFGIAICVLAAILLALPKGVRLSDRDSTLSGNESTESSEFTPLFTFFLFFSSIFIWVVCDSLSPYVARDMHMFHVLLFTGIGFGLLALFCAVVSFILVASAGGGSLYSPEAFAAALALNKNTSTIRSEEKVNSEASSFGGVTSVVGGYFIFFLAQLSGTTGWWLSVTLGQESEGSAFLPVTCLYTTLTALMSVAFLGETLSIEAWFGIVLASIGMLCIAKNKG